jgi:hypothetical protein
MSAKGLGLFLLSLLMGTLYATLVGLLSRSLAGPLISWPIWIGLFWLAFSKFNGLRFAGFIAVLPVSLVVFEAVRSVRHPGMNADLVRSFDRSHYTPGYRVKNPKFKDRVDGPKEILIGKDGFRADPASERGNPERCQFALIGDSMIYGTGLAYRFTLGPVLADMGLQACVFGVTGNSPIDYLATLKYVADRIDPGAYVAVYFYANNDFIGLNGFFKRGVLIAANSLQKLFEWSFYYDRWRQATWTYSLFHGWRTPPPVRLYQYEIVKGNLIKVLYSRDPAAYEKPKPLTSRQRSALSFFLNGLNELVKDRPWHVIVLIHPDDSEIYANFARPSPVFVDLDPRRAESLKMCKEFSFQCEDMSRFIYERSFAAGKNPYFDDDRHFSPFGVRIVAEHFVALTKRGR